MSPDVKVLDDYLMNGNSNNVSDLKTNDSDSTHNHNNNNNPSCSIHLEDNENERTVRNCSPVSDNSQSVTILSRDEYDTDSTVASDSENEDDFPPKNALKILEKLSNGSTTHNNNQAHNDGAIIVNQNVHEDAIRSQIGSIAVENSSNIQFGNKTIYQGPVIINRILWEKDKFRPSSGENDNPTFPNENKWIANDLGDKKEPVVPNPKEPLTFKSILKKYKKYIILNAVGLLLVLSVVMGLVLAFRSGATKIIDNSGDGDRNVKDNKDSHIGETLPHSVSKLRLVTRDEWIAQPPDKKLTELELPVNRVIITHTASEGCDTQATCVYRVRMIQTYHMESKKWDDIGYNFLVGGDGAVYEGRGWDKQGAHTKGYNAGSIGIALIGTFINKSPPQRQFDALKLILEEGIRLGKLTTDYKMYPHRAFYGTESPGLKVIEVLKTWPHYVGSLV